MDAKITRYPTLILPISDDTQARPRIKGPTEEINVQWKFSGSKIKRTLDYGGINNRCFILQQFLSQVIQGGAEVNRWITNNQQKE